RAGERRADVGEQHDRDDQDRNQEAAGVDGDAEVVEAVDRERRTEGDGEQQYRERPDQVEEAGDDPARLAAEVPGEQREGDREERTDEGGADTDQERIQSAV